MTKPDPRIFELAIERLGIEAEEAIMVDDIDTNCEVAESIGMKSITYQNFGQFKTELEQLLSRQ